MYWIKMLQGPIYHDSYKNHHVTDTISKLYFLLP